MRVWPAHIRMGGALRLREKKLNIRITAFFYPGIWALSHMSHIQCVSLRKGLERKVFFVLLGLKGMAFGKHWIQGNLDPVVGG